jgi:hypothetical protein
MTSELPGEVRAPWVAQLRAFSHEAFFPLLSERGLPAPLEEASAQLAGLAFRLVSRLKFRCCLSTLACSGWVLALPPFSLKVPEELPEPILGLALTVTQRAQYQCTAQIAGFAYAGASTRFSAAS